MRTAVCAIVKNEHRYLEEWITYHLNIGFDEIYIGEDYGSKSHKSIVDKFDQERVHIILLEEYIPNHHCTIGKKGRQVTYYNKFFQENKDKFDWIANIDIDEFIILEDGTLEEFLNEYSEYEGVCLSWKYYGANGHLTPPEGGVMENYTQYIDNPPCDCQVKTIVNCHLADKVRFMHAATNNCVDVFKNFSFKKSLMGFNRANSKYWHKAWINHYFTRSWQEWVERMVRGNMQNNFRTLDTFFVYNPDMVHMQKKLTFEAYKQAKNFCTTNIYSRKYSLYSKEYSKKLKDSFFKRIGR